jgi:acylphosphatase
MSQMCRRFLVSGRVQGVWFRESTRREAVKLKLTGRAVNLPDGRVEVIAAGSEANIKALAKWLQQGPPMASVDRVIEETADATEVSGFTTG